MSRLQRIWAGWSLYVYAVALSLAFMFAIELFLDAPHEVARWVRLAGFPVFLFAAWLLRESRHYNARASAESRWENEHRR